jgi:response regulator of citrate/malate metabolism
MKYQDVTILLIDGDKSHADLFEDHLRKKDVTNTLIHFNNGFSIAKYLFDTTIDHEKYTYLIILDIYIIGLDSQNLLKNIREKYLIDNTIILTLSESYVRSKASYTKREELTTELSKPIIQNSFEKTLSDFNIFLRDCETSSTKKFVLASANIAN